MHLSVNLFIFYSVLVLFFNPMLPLLLSSSKLFELNSLPHNYLTFLGDSHFQHGRNAMYGTNAIALTGEDMVLSTGMVLYNRPILFVDRKNVPSFSTMFAFSIKNVDGNGEDFGDGLAFFISPDDDPLGSPGYLGLVDSTDLNRNKFIAIEFDTNCDPKFHDPDDNHLGLDINSLSSVQLATSLGINLKSGDLIRTWIDYKGDVKRLEVFLSDLNLKPVKPILKVDIDLSDYLKESMFVGFSAATKGSLQLTCIEQWEFTIVEFSPPPPPPSLLTFQNPSKSGHRHGHLGRLALGIIIGAFSFSFLVVLVWFCWKESMGMVQKLGETNNLDMQTIRSPERTSEIILSIPDTMPDEIARGLSIEKVLGNEAELIRVKIVKFSISHSQ